MAAYRYGELGQVYPIVRGSVPLLVTARWLFSGRPATHHAGDPRRRARCGRHHGVDDIDPLRAGDGCDHRRLCDGRRHRRSRGARQRRLYGLGAGALRRLAAGDLRRLARQARRRFRRAGNLEGAGRRPVRTARLWRRRRRLRARTDGPITAIRETSVVFAAFIGRLFLGEALTPRRVGACGVVALGAICLGYQA
ncbi:conserved hypothetical protein [Mesorhizobium metallidurans STM 2683]|uniref:EamA domain-containing protein n=1 Tax=Mesorhizobium metallidurans STM 2683 TaxID=1297569 RepID=M5ENY6_9HYPH|nr:conserved hypothetical protein [Mesorhizobium metallidurans STM 2683]